MRAKRGWYGLLLAVPLGCRGDAGPAPPAAATWPAERRPGRDLPWAIHLEMPSPAPPRGTPAGDVWDRGLIVGEGEDGPAAVAFWEPVEPLDWPAAGGRLVRVRSSGRVVRLPRDAVCWGPPGPFQVGDGVSVPFRNVIEAHAWIARTRP
jgi:hypothetical protein